jgi:hypothetical protein
LSSRGRATAPATGTGVFARRYNSAGVAQGSEFRVNQTTGGTQDNPAAGIDLNGNFVIVWRTDQTGSDVYYRRYDSSGTALTGEIRANASTTNNQYQPAVAMSESGSYVITWRSDRQDLSGAGVFHRRYDSNGNVLDAADVQVNTINSGNQEKPSIAYKLDGSGYVITWVSGGNQDGDNKGHFRAALQLDLARSSAASSRSIRTSTTIRTGRASPSIRTATFTIVWGSNNQDGNNYGVYGQKYDWSGNPIDAEQRFSSTDQRRAEPARSRDELLRRPVGGLAGQWSERRVGHLRAVLPVG